MDTDRATESSGPSRSFDAGAFLSAMSRFPAGVTVVTTSTAQGDPAGFTATAFSSVSADPPLVLVCLAKTATSHEAFLAATHWAIHILGQESASLAMTFATKGIDKFSDGFDLSADGLPLLRVAPIIVECESYDKYDAGDHTILVGRVVQASVREDEPLIYFSRAFRALAPLHRGDITGIDWQFLNGALSGNASFGLL